MIPRSQSTHAQPPVAIFLETNALQQLKCSGSGLVQNVGEPMHHQVSPKLPYTSLGWMCGGFRISQNVGCAPCTTEHPRNCRASAWDKTPANNTCASLLKNPNPSGFYYKDIWTSHVCYNQDFNTSIKVAQCLAEKMVYMFGDSTLRQWWEYLVKFVPTLKQIDLHVTHNPGPLLATDSDNNYIVEWRAHQKPLRMERTGIKELQYIATELHRLGPRKNMVIVLTCWSHFLTYPISFYVRRLWHIREAVKQLLERSPDTKILIKSANTGYRFDHGSDWLSYQLDTVMRAMFSELPVTILDVWQMTSCHREPENLHPKGVIVKNEVDLMLSFICPQ
ncbi:NXPE family member 3-like [Dendrobates tinctorius]|uniref:NXPE family member 3-like n=1 Tax=Dendrobates tinctorius TaxID=92724 RepID=UPI003CCA33C0